MSLTVPVWNARPSTLVRCHFRTDRQSVRWWQDATMSLDLATCLARPSGLATITIKDDMLLDSNAILRLITYPYLVHSRREMRSTTHLHTTWIPTVSITHLSSGQKLTFRYVTNTNKKKKHNNNTNAYTRLYNSLPISQKINVSWYSKVSRCEQYLPPVTSCLARCAPRFHTSCRFQHQAKWLDPCNLRDLSPPQIPTIIIQYIFHNNTVKHN